MTYRFLAEARAEFDDAVDWYDAQQSGLGDDFSAEAYATVQRIIADPRSYPLAPRAPAGHEVRVAPIHRFSYLIFSEPTASEVVIVSVGHGKRGRQTWRGRLTP